MIKKDMELNIEKDDNIETEDIKLTDQDIIIKLFTSPRQAFKFINDNYYDKYLYLLLILGGITRTFDRASSKNSGDTMSLIGIVAMCIIVGALLGWLTYYIYGGLLSWTGKWLRGQGDTNSLVLMLSYAMVPSILTLVIVALQIIIFGEDTFKSDPDISNYSLALSITYYFLIFLELVLGVWALCLVVIGISEVQKLSIGKSILNMILPGLVILVPIIVMVMLFKTFN